ncbi:MAG: serine hydrolase domain-containing protein [Acidimicrobiia bacterium]
MRPHRRLTHRVLITLALVCAAAFASTATAGAATSAADTLDAALAKFIAKDGASPGISVVVQGSGSPELHTAGVANVDTDAPIALNDQMRMASVAKAYSGAAAAALVGDGKLEFSTTIGEVLPDQPSTWSKITLAQLMQHTSGIADFSGSKDFRAAVQASPDVSPPPAQLPTYVAKDPLLFTPGSKYKYSNTDNILIGLMVAAVTNSTYEQQLASLVYGPMSLKSTSLPSGVAMPSPYVHAYVVDPPNAPEDVSEPFAAGWAWASGGIVATPADANAFVRGYVSGATIPESVSKQQFKFRAGHSEPIGPGKNSVGLSVFRYETKCGTVYGHTGNTAGFTQFAASDRKGEHSVVVSVNAQITPNSNAKLFVDLRRIYELGVCAALDAS